MASEIQYLDTLCKELYESTDQQVRLTAERALSEFSDSPACLRQCMLLLEHGSCPYAPLVASNTLTKLVSKTGVTLEERYELRNYLLNYLVHRKNLPNFVVTSLCQLFARLTKLGWFDFDKEREYMFRTSVDDIAKLAQESIDRCALSVQLLGHLVAEMNSSNAMSSITKHRKVAASFRDVQLFDIFQLTVSMLQTAYDSIKSVDDAQLNLINGLLQLALNCLTFDFIGSMIDDTSDDNVNVQVPTVWRIAFIDTTILKLFFGLYASLPGDLPSKALACLVQLASIRRTIFNNNERQTFLSQLCAGVKAILDNSEKLSDQATFHEFCRLVARLKSNYQLSELIKVDEYPKIVRLLAEFTVQSLRMYQFSANSTYYLLSFWQRMVSSMPYVKASEPHLLDQFAPMVTTAFIESRLQLADAVVNEGLDDPLDDSGSLIQQMEQVSVIGRCEYQRTCALLLQLFDGETAAFERALASGDAKVQTQSKTRLTWLVMVIGAAVGGRVAFSSSDDHDLIDGDLICRVLRLMEATDQRLATEPGSEKLELAFLWHLEQFRKIYISDQVQKTSKVYNKLSEMLGLNDESAVLAVFVRKIITNLKYWASNEKLIDDTLTLLNDLSVGYSSVRKLVRLPEVQFLMNNHTNEHFSFLGASTDLKTMKSRTTLYAALTRLLCVDLNDDDDAFDRFMLPLTEAMNELCKVFQMTAATSAVVDQEQVKRAVIGLSRDIRGVAVACNTKTAYGMLFDWLYPDLFALLQRAIEYWYADADLTTPVLKLMNELCQNRSQRLQFEMSSPNAILLFKEAAKLICTYGSRILTISEVAKDQAYKLRYKGVGACFGILKVALSGSYINFGVFRLYGDSCLDDALSMFIKLLLTIPQRELL
uniref:Importin N-terminal domain-containing protein n=2 Tax=Plectus sambesii TaxID=2011161 RepID=A0A914V6U4_9BILA